MQSKCVPENIPFSGNRAGFAFLLHGGSVRDPRLLATMGKAGVCLIALQVLLVRIAQSGVTADA